MLTPFRAILAAVGRGLRLAGGAFAQAVGPYEICEVVVAGGCYLFAREYFSIAASAGIAMIAGGGLACAINLLTDLQWLKHVEGGKR